MNRPVSIPPEFGGSWQTFVQEWCRAASLANEPTVVADALSTLTRLWPDEAARLIGEPVRGVGVLAPAVELGLLLRTCESVAGFGDVLRRLVNRERSAYSELVLVAALRRLGYEVRFAPPIDEHVLDAACDVDGAEVYFEVVAPERPLTFQDQQRLVDELTAQARRVVCKCRVEIEIRATLDVAATNQIVAAVESAESSTWVEVGSLARVRRIDAGQALLPAFDGEGAKITTPGDSTTVIARWESSDARAKRIFNQEYHQFSERVPNVLVIDVCAVSDGMTLWPEEMAHLLQPTRNRKVGAVVFFEQGSLGPPEAIRRRWRVVVNPHAHLPVPEQVLSGLESLDESSFHGLARPERMSPPRSQSAQEAGMTDE